MAHPGKRSDFFIIARSFWPASPVIGDALFDLAELLAQRGSCSVLTQSQRSLASSIRYDPRAYDVNFSLTRALSTSRSSVWIRSLDLVWFSMICLYEITKQRPKVVYVTSDPPLLVPFVVFFCSKLFGFSYVYHVQDIHPEATQVAVKNLNRLVAFVAKRMDTLSLNSAAKIITLTEEMKVTLLCNRNAGLWNKIDLIDNPTGLTAEAREGCVKRFDFAFVGTMGRLQRIPLLATSIGNYLRKGGDKKFVFVGDGIHAKTVQKLMSEFPANVFYFGRLTVEASSRIISESKALLVPIEDEVCNFAFPSKIATYAASSSPLVCICGERTSAARWVLENNAGFVVQPTNQGLEELFKRASLTADSTIGRGHSVKRKKNIFSKEEFARKLHDILIKTLH